MHAAPWLSVLAAPRSAADDVPCGQAAGNGDHTNVFLWTGTETDATIELTHNWDGEDEAKMDPQGDRKFGHIAIGVDDIYGICAKLADMGYIILRPPRDGNMAFVKTPDGASIELLQNGNPLAPAEPWESMESVTNSDGSFTW